MDIQFLYFEDCPSHEAALQRLRDVLNEMALSATLEVVRVETEAEAQRLRFVGSPTILINGQDIVPPDQHSAYTLACRAYQLEDGRISPLPSVEMLRAAFGRAVGAGGR